MPIFQSTLPARGATELPSGCWTTRHFNPRSPHGERPHRTLCEVALGLFQSTLPARGATPRPTVSIPMTMISIHAPRTGSDAVGGIGRFGLDISIHAPRTGSDRLTSSVALTTSYFNPRSPHGERLYTIHVGDTVLAISIHAPRTGSDSATAFFAPVVLISIHAPRTGSDLLEKRLKEV